MNTKTPKGNGSDEPSPQSPSSIAQRSRLRRTLLFASVFALLAMIYVPTPRHGYRFVFEWSNTSVAFFQLLINVVFAALAGAIVASLPKRVLIAIGVCIAIAAAVIAETARVKHYWMRAQDYEGYAESWLSAVNYQRPNEAARRAKECFLDAASNWRLAWQFDKAEQAKRKANDSAARMETIRQEAEAEAKRKEDLERRLAQEREFDRQWKINAQRVMDAHPELRYENSLYSQAMRKVLNSNPAYSQRVDGFELAYKVIMKQLPPPTNPREGIPTSEFHRLLDNLKADVGAEAERAETARASEASDSGPKKTASKKTDRTYIVQSGDTLFSISRRFYGSPERWKEILDTNKKNIRDPKKLTVGQTLVIP